MNCRYCFFDSYRWLRALGLFVGLLLGLMLALLPAAHAHEGHAHGPALKPVDVPLLPRFEAQGETMEVVGVLAGDSLQLYLDRFGSNAPVSGATIELDSPALKGVARELGPGVYALPAAALRGPGKYPLALTISSGEALDLLAAELVVSAANSGGVAGLEPAGWRAWSSLLWLLVAGPVLWLGQYLIRRGLPLHGGSKPGFLRLGKGGRQP